MALMLGSASPAPATSEQELIVAARTGDDRSFEELYARYRDRIGAFIRARMRDHTRAEDVAQEVFISALRRLRGSDQEIIFKPWIYEIAKNACIDEHRRNQRYREISLDSSDELSGGGGALVSIAPTPAAAMEGKQKLDDLRGAFGGLSQSHHQLLVMREFEGLSYDEIGRRTGMSRQMVESALFRARRKLGVEYEELASGRRCLQVQTAVEAGKLSSRRGLGVRERRQLARHLAHCQPCRVKAHLAGVDDSLFRPTVGAKIAALLPFPVWRLWPFGRSARSAAMQTGSHPGLQAATSAVEPGAGALLGSAAVVAAIALAGAGAAAGPAHHRATHRARARNAPAATPLGNGQRVAATRPPVGISGMAPRSARGAAQGPRGSGDTSIADGTGSHRGGGSPPAHGPLAGTGPVRSGAAIASGTINQVSGTVQHTTAVVKQTVSGVTHTLGNATSTVGRTINQAPVGQTVDKVLSFAPILGGSQGSSLSGSSGTSGSTGASARQTPLGAGGNIPATVGGVTKKLTGSVSTLLAHR
jgi:RNA polymerase sigma factor (sigma-70 family)